MNPVFTKEALPLLNTSLTFPITGLTSVYLRHTMHLTISKHFVCMTSRNITTVRTKWTLQDEKIRTRLHVYVSYFVQSTLHYAVILP